MPHILHSSYEYITKDMVSPDMMRFPRTHIDMIHQDRMLQNPDTTMEDFLRTEQEEFNKWENSIQWQKQLVPIESLPQKYLKSPRFPANFLSSNFLLSDNLLHFFHHIEDGLKKMGRDDIEVKLALCRHKLASSQTANDTTFHLMTVIESKETGFKIGGPIWVSLLGHPDFFSAVPDKSERVAIRKESYNTLIRDMGLQALYLRLVDDRAVYEKKRAAHLPEHRDPAPEEPEDLPNLLKRHGFFPPDINEKYVTVKKYGYSELAQGMDTLKYPLRGVPGESVTYIGNKETTDFLSQEVQDDVQELLKLVRDAYTSTLQLKSCETPKYVNKVLQPAMVKYVLGTEFPDNSNGFSKH